MLNFDSSIYLNLNFKKQILKYIFSIIILGISASLYSQCSPPFSIRFSDRNLNSFQIRWSDSNINPLGWDIEVIEKGSSPTGIPTNSSLISEKNYTVNLLKPSTMYEIYLRTSCTENTKSGWNGPFNYTTILTNPTNCKTFLPLKDNNTDTFFIQVPNPGILGQDIFIASVEIIVGHDWPADLKISLENPRRKSTTLSNYYGTITNDFGDINDVNCNKTAIFSDQACNTIKSGKPPYIGQYIPEEPLSLLEDGASANGIWRLVFVDRAILDVGLLQFVKINFSNEKCQTPIDFTITSINSQSVSVAWQRPLLCNSAKITIGTPDQNIDDRISYFVACVNEKFIIPDLQPEVDYEIFICSVCDFSISPPGCIQNFKTKCEQISLSENFDQYPKCVEGCDFKCDINGFWFNHPDNPQDWIVWSGRTDTENTGPDADVSQEQNYIYIENTPSLCGINNLAVLQSKCLTILSNQGGCDMSFNYHMFGNEIESLILEISIDNGNTWEKLFEKSGNQGNRWFKQLVNLSSFDNELAILRFVATSSSGLTGDIALDNIEFYGSMVNPNQVIYFRDEDGDGFGDSNKSISSCSSEPPSGYVDIGGDCNDQDAFINPDAPEILCNLIDENCNGLSDDVDPNNSLVYTYTVENESCQGVKDGNIILQINGGNPPYEVLWNNNVSDVINSNIGHGVYFAKISDYNGCILMTDFIDVYSDFNIQSIIVSTTKPSCLGMANGEIIINHSSGSEPYSYIWSNGSTNQNLISVEEGTYAYTITDSNGCVYLSPEINLLSNPSLIADSKFKKHPNCFGLKNGEIEITTINGTPPYHYRWDNIPNNTAHIKDLAAGQYTSTVTDAQGCYYIYTTTLTQPSEITSKIVSTEPTRCFGEKNGSIKTDTKGGSPPYTFFWNNGQFTDDLFNLSAGFYNLSITDKNGCLSRLSNIEVKQPQLFTAQIDSIIPAKCIQGKNGAIYLSAKGGTSPYFYNWNPPGSISSHLKDIKSGNYEAVVIDQNGCKASIRSILLPYINNPIKNQISLITDNVCYKDSIGQINVLLTEGKAPFDFNWNNGKQNFSSSLQDSIKNLPPGNYNVTITDADGCIGISENIMLKNKPEISYIVEEVTQNICKTDSTAYIKIKSQGGIGSKTIFWFGQQPGHVITDLKNGLYDGFIMDSVGCTIDILPIAITSKSNLSFSTSLTNTQPDLATGTYCIDIFNGIAPFEVIWDSKVTRFDGNCAVELSTGWYSFTVTDAEMCVIQDSFFIDQISSIINSFDEKNEVILYPNPAIDIIHIESKYKIGKVEVFDLSGKLLISKQVNQEKFELDISELKNGMALLKLSSTNKFYFLKLAKI